MKKIIEKYPVLIFCTANLLTAAIVLIVTHFTPNGTPQWSPGLYAMVIVAILSGKEGIFRIVKKLTFKRKFWKWYIVAFAIPVIVCTVSYMAVSLIENTGMGDVKFVHSPHQYFIFLLLIILGGIGEEIGWRGFMLPQLQKKHSLFVSSLIIGLIWGIWHLNIQSGLLVFIVYTLLVIDFSLITSWLYAKTEGNIAVAIILHSTINMCSLLFFEKIVTYNGGIANVLLVMYVTLTVFFSLPCIWIVGNMLSKKSDNSNK